MYELWWIDVETTGLDPITDEIIEISLIQSYCDPVKRFLSPIQSKYTGLREPSCPISIEAFKVNGISLEQVMGKHLDHELLTNIITHTDVFIAHNASFDRSFFEKLFPEVMEKKWFCSMNGINWKKWGFASLGLQSLLKSHHIFPKQAHRAESDVVSLYRLLQEYNPMEKTYFWEMWDNNYHRFLNR